MEGMVNLEFRTSRFETCHPMFQEVALWCYAKTSDRQGKRNLPIPRFAHHVSSFGINGFDRFGPLWMVGLGLRSL
jgi:hypothetical protein